MNWQFDFGKYVKGVFDKNRDGRITLSEVIESLPNNGITIAIVVVDIIMVLAEYLVWDVAMKITDGDIIKSLGFVAISALPFYIGQLLWLYPHANGWQKWISGGAVALSLYTSWLFGTADLSLDYDISALGSYAADLRAVYVVALIGYVLSDNRVRAWRRKKEQEASVKEQEDYNAMADRLLDQLAKSLAKQDELVKQYGEEAVTNQLRALRGQPTKKDEKKQPAPPMLGSRPVNAYQSDADTERLENPTDRQRQQ